MIYCVPGKHLESIFHGFTAPEITSIQKASGASVTKSLDRRDEERPEEMNARAKDRAEQMDPESEWAYILWHSYLTGDLSRLDMKVKAVRQIFKRLPSEPRCRVCQAPFRGIGGALVGVLGFGAGRSSFNPSLCGRCERIVKKHQVGAEIELTTLFADVRGSTTLAEEVGVFAFQSLINRFYQVCARVLAESDALVVRLIGDAVIGLYVPGIAGSEHARTAVDAACALLKATGHADSEGPWIEVGIGIHSGRAYVGAVGSSDIVTDITVLGDVANTTTPWLRPAGAQPVAQLGPDHVGIVLLNVMQARPNVQQRQVGQMLLRPFDHWRPNQSTRLRVKEQFGNFSLL